MSAAERKLDSLRREVSSLRKEVGALNALVRPGVKNKNRDGQLFSVLRKIARAVGVKGDI